MVVLLAVAIGAATALSSLFLYIVRDRPPVDRPDAIVTIWQRSPAALRGRAALTLEDFNDWIAPAASSALPTALVSGRAVLRARDPLLVAEQRVGGSFFPLLGRTPRIGRAFTDEEVRTGAAVAIVSGRLFRRAFDADRNALGRIVRIDERPYEIVGVMPDDFWFAFGRDADLWRPLPADTPLRTPAILTARLRDRELPSTLETALNAAARRDGAGREPARAVVQALSEESSVKLGPGLVGLVGPALLILLCACANAANLILIANAAREKEFAIRAALGASPARLLWQSAFETLPVVMSAGGAGLLLAYWGQHLFVRLLIGGPGDAPAPAPPSWTVAAAALAMTAVAVPAAGLLPAIAASRANVAAAFRETLRTPRYGRGQYGAFDLLLVLQVGLAVVLVLMAALFFGFLREYSRVVPNFDARTPLTLDAHAPAASPLIDVLGSVERSGHVLAIGLASRPPAPVSGGSRIRVTDQGGERECVVAVTFVTPGYFEALQLADMSGRVIRPDPGALVMSQAAANACGQRSPVGTSSFRIDGRDGGPRWLTASAIVRDTFQPNRIASWAPLLYVVTVEGWAGNLSVVARMQTGRDGEDLRAALRRAAPNLPVGAVRTVRARIDAQLARPRASTFFVAVLAALALLIAMTGVAAALHHAVTVRRLEFGVRLAVGATPARLIGATIARDFPLVVAGEAAGLLVTIASTRGYWPDLLALSGTDPVVWLLVCGVLALSAAAAAAVPIARAVRLDPVRLLRHT